MKTNKKKTNNQGNNKTEQMPDTVKLRDNKGNITTISYRKLKIHEKSIIEDNIEYALRHNEFTAEEIDAYEKKAINEWKELKRKLRENPDLLLTIDETTERIVPYVENKKNV